MPSLSTPAAASWCQLADYDVAALAEHITAATSCPTPRARRAAAKAFHHAFARDHRGTARWDDEALREAGLGRWVRPCLLELSPAIALTVAERARSEDGTERLLLQAPDGALFESVIIPAEAGRDRARTTLCLSSQVGCARGCTFCETATLGLERQLTAGEMVDQYRIARRMCEPDAPDRPEDSRVAKGPAATPGDGVVRDGQSASPQRAISNIVFMGMGEPLDNLTALTRATSLLCTQQAFAVPPSRITVSTAGVADQLASFFRDTRAELAISLNAPDDERRSALMPINRRFDLARLRAALVSSLPPGRRVLIQYALFADFNDAPEDADALAAYLGDLPARVNVIPANPGPRLALRSPSAAAVEAFTRRLQGHGVTTLVRLPRGRDVGGACGQLAGARRHGASREPSSCPCP
ncbi:MAG: 23S rRNA (adenine(2503)-C(2))-methyltransferase RlmN [Deltaproteobacteria bacterium]|nr:23S rRNA (adenine(2503)-C(2))-methyltransferase RlmN [Deltaproteobacteria bacterium]